MALDLTPAYTLRERLNAAAMAGTALLAEDFRLRRALDDFAPLEAAGGVLARIGQSVRALLAADCPDPAGALLDAMNLLEAVLCTQAAVGVGAPMQPVTLSADAAPPVQIPYSVLHPLLEALRSGRAKSVSEQRYEHPEWFRDHRVRIAMVNALDADRSDLAGLVQRWLSEENENLLLLLKAGFEPSESKNMFRRVQVISAIAGGTENQFYIDGLQTAAGTTRQALLFALRHDPANAELLLTLARTERGNAKKIARRALAYMDAPAVWDFWQKHLEKHPEEIGMLAWTTSAGAAALAAQRLAPMLEMMLHPLRSAQRDEVYSMSPQVEALVGKNGPQICDLYRSAAQTARRLQQDAALRRRLHELSAMVGETGETLFTKVLPRCLCESLVLNPAADLLALADELYRDYGSLWLGPYLVAGLLTLPADQACQRLQQALKPAHLFGRMDAAVVPGIEAGLQMLRWNRSRARWEFVLSSRDPVRDDVFIAFRRPLPWPLSPDWITQLCRLDDPQLDQSLMGLIRPDDPERCAVLGELFYRHALAAESHYKVEACIDALRQCGWQQCKGLAVRYFMRRGYLDADEAGTLLYRLPGNAAAVAQEADKLYAMAIARPVRLNGCKKEHFYALAAEWHRRAAAEKDQ